MKHLIKKQTILIGNTSFRIDTYQIDRGRVSEVKVKDVAPNPFKGGVDEPEDG